MKLKLDENLGNTVARIFEVAGHDVATVRGQGMSKAPDENVIAACRYERRCLVTTDLDFSNPLVYDPARHHGIAVIRLPAKPAHGDLLESCRTMVKALMGNDIEGKLWIVQRGRVRVYRPESLRDKER